MAICYNFANYLMDQVRIDRSQSSTLVLFHAKNHSGYIRVSVIVITHFGLDLDPNCLTEFLKDFLESVFLKKSADCNKRMKNYQACHIAKT